MGISFHAGCYFAPHQERENMFTTLYQHCQKHGFEYLATDRYGPTFEAQRRSIANGEADSFWIAGMEGKMLVSIGNKPQQFGFSSNDKIALLCFIFNYYFITTGDIARNQRFLEGFLSLQSSLYTAFKAKLGWAGYDPSIPSADEYQSGRIKAVRWFNIFSPRFVETIGREKLLHAPAWQIKELADGSVIVRLSEHPHVYEKIGGVYLHEYLGLEYIN